MMYLKLFTHRIKTATGLAALMLTAAPSYAQLLVETEPPKTSGWKSEILAKDISHPWGMAWLPSGEMLVTSRDGEVFKLRGTTLSKVQLAGLPKPFAEKQGGLMDIAIHPKAQAGQKTLVYMTLSTGTERANRTILVRGTYDGERVSGIKEIFRVTPDKTGGQHFGSRLAWLPDHTLLMSVGDGGNPPLRVGGMLSREQAQNLSTHLGSIIRLTEDGAPARDNPFVGQANAKPEIWSYGHRNIQGLTVEPGTGRVWATEHGPLGGDELNLVQSGHNFGWPLASFGRDYRTGIAIGKRHIEGMIDAKVVWLPTSVAPSGLAVYAGDRFPKWRGNVFSGNLVTEDIHRVTVDAQGKAVSVERLEIGERVRDVKEGPDGYLYVLTDEDNGKVIRIMPE
jgi:glucose/arabinose dehydrogenase